MGARRRFGDVRTEMMENGRCSFVFLCLQARVNTRTLASPSCLGLLVVIQFVQVSIDLRSMLCS